MESSDMVSHVLKERYGSHIPRLTGSGGSLSADTAVDLQNDGESEDGYVGQLPGHVAAPFGNVGQNPFVGGASADTRLAVQTGTTVVGHDAGKSQNSTECGASHNPATTMGFEQEASAAFPTDSKERENERRRRLKEEGQ